MPGEGTQYVGMARQLYACEPEFAVVLDHCCAVLRESHGLDLTSVLFPVTAEAATRAEAMIGRTSATQPALFVVEYALARLLISWGMKPAAMVGHGVGEYVAAALAGVMDADDALRLVADRGQLIESLPPGAMTAVLLPEHELRPLLPPPAKQRDAYRLPGLSRQSEEHSRLQHRSSRAKPELQCERELKGCPPDMLDSGPLSGFRQFGLAGGHARSSNPPVGFLSLPRAVRRQAARLSSPSEDDNRRISLESDG